jgi:long-subunit fatty acid transport protein
LTPAEPPGERLDRLGTCIAGTFARRWRGRGALALAALLPASGVQAAGFDTPILYTARHQGMGGAAIGYVDDPSAAFHNPAGLQGVHGLALLGDISLILAHVTGSPAAPASASGIQSQLTVAPFFMAAGAYRVAPWLSAGLAVFPVASGGADYEYPVPDSDIYQYNATTIVFYEVTPVISLNVPKDAVLPGALSFGIGYRLNVVSFVRQQGERDNPRGLDLDLRGYGFQGLRAGMQYRAGELFSLGLVFRNRVTVTAEADEATVLGNTATKVELPFTLPAQFGAGIRSDYERLGVAFDAMYTFQSQNDRADLSGTIAGNLVRVPNVFDWRDAFTLRFGFEFRLGPAEQLPIRVGYVYDEKVANRAYPSAFGTPPAPTRTFTLGGGYDTGPWEINLALALRSGDTTLRPEEIASPAACPTCGYSGQYGVNMTGLYVDFSTDLEL